ncbi:MAG: hypothetical protein AAF502_02095 [Bacteroidota bacterium]
MRYFIDNFLDFCENYGGLILFWLPLVVIYPHTFISEIPVDFHFFIFPAAILMVLSWKLDSRVYPYLAGTILYTIVYFFYIAKTPDSFTKPEKWTLMLLIGIILLFCGFLGAVKKARNASISAHD